MQTVLVFKVAVFVLTTLLLAYISRASLVAPRSHGFYRFFVWEAILALVLLAIDHWFRSPFAWNQLVSWFLLSVSLFLLIHGANLLKRVGTPDPGRSDPTLMWIKTTTLVTEGAYHYIRHPMYSSLLFAAWGLFFKDPSWTGGFLALAATLLLLAAARSEEAEDIRYFGVAYQEYMEGTKRFIPFLY